MIYTENRYVYAWFQRQKLLTNIGKKTSRKESYISSISSAEFWKDLASEEMEHYILWEGEDAETAGAVEWWAMDYGMKINGKESFYNRQNNAHRGNQDLVTPEIKAKIVAFFEGKLTPEKRPNKSVSLAENIILAVENGGYPVVKLPVYEIAEYESAQARAVQSNIKGEDDIVRSYEIDAKRVMDEVTPMTICERKDGTRVIVNGHTRLGAAQRCRGWNTMPVCIVKEEEFGDNEVDIKSNMLQAGSFANRRSFVTSTENTDEDLVFQMEKEVELRQFDLSNELALKTIRDHLTDMFENAAGSRYAASGMVTKLFNKFKETQNEMSITANLLTYNDTYLTGYCYKNYESKGIPVVKGTASRVKHMHLWGHIWNHIVDKDKVPPTMAIVIHYRSKSEFLTELKEKNIEDLKKVIKLSGFNVIVDVLPAFKE